MGHWCLKKSDNMGGGVLSETLLLTFDRYIELNLSVSIKISNPNCLKQLSWTNEGDVRQKNTNKVLQVDLKPFASKLKRMKLFIH